MLNDSRLSWEARGLLAYLLSKPDNWRVSRDALASQGPAGRDKIGRILKELKEIGYLQIDQRRDENGQFIYENIIRESPESPAPENPSLDASAPDNAPLISTREISTEERSSSLPLEETQIVNTKISSRLKSRSRKTAEPDPFFEQAWAMYRKRDHDSKVRGRQAWARSLAAAGGDPAPLLQGVARYMRYCEGTETQYIKGFAVFFGPDEFWRREWRPEQARPRAELFTDRQADAADRALANERAIREKEAARYAEKERIHRDTGIDVDDPACANLPETLAFRRQFV